MKRKSNPLVEALRKAHQNTTLTMRDRRERRPKDAKRSWKKEEWS